MLLRLIGVLNVKLTKEIIAQVEDEGQNLVRVVTIKTIDIFIGGCYL